MSRSRFLRRGAVVLSVWLLLGSAAGAHPRFPRPNRYEPTADERKQVEEKTAALAAAVKDLQPPATPRDRADDVAVFLKAGQRALRFDEFFDKKDVATTLAVLDRGLER